MLYFSKITLASASSIAQNLILLQRNGAYASHQLLWKLFFSEQERCFLYRHDQLDNGLPVFWVLSEVEPQCIEPGWDVTTKSFLPKISSGEKLAYKLRANPTIYDKTTDKRHDVMMHAKFKAREQQEPLNNIQELMQDAARNWLADPRRLSQWGITLDTVPDIDGYTQHRCTKKSGRVIQFSSVDYHGILTVQDPELFLKQYAKGFGRSKCFGCGLMLIRRV